MIPLLQEEPIVPQSDNEDIFYLFLVLCIIFILAYVAKFIKQRKDNSPYRDSLPPDQDLNKSNAEAVSYGYTTNEGETLFDDVKPSDDEVEYRIVGTNYRDLSKKDIGYSDNFFLNATDEVKGDKYAVEIYNERRKLVGYIEHDLNKFWHKLLIKANPDNPVMRCRGYIGQFRNENDELKFYGKVFLPEIDEKDPDYKKIMNE